MDEDKSTVRIALNLRPDRPRQALILDWLYAACGRSGRFYGLTPRMEAAMFLYRAWSMGQVRIVPVPGIPDDVLFMLAEMGITTNSAGGASAGTEAGVAVTTPASEPAAMPVSEQAVGLPDSDVGLHTTEIMEEGGEATPAYDKDSPMAKLVKGIKW